jgi:peptidyl-tRNA hydrolase
MKFRRDELAVIGDAVQKAADSIEAIIADGAERAMNKFNG